MSSDKVNLIVKEWRYNWGDVQNVKTAKGNSQTGSDFIAFEEINPLQGAKVTIWSKLYQSSSRIYDSQEDNYIDRAWSEALAKIPFDLDLIDVTDDMLL